MKGCILAVGTELLFGQIDNTNASYLSRELNNIGIDILYHRTVGDNPSRLEEQIVDIFKDCNLILTTGGLGPTQDDLTKETIAKVFGKKLVLDEKELEYLKNIFSKREKPMAESNIKQVMMPEDCIILHNDNGTAPGFILSAKRKDIIKNEAINNQLDADGVDLDEMCTIVSMPGPPREMKPMYENDVAPYLMKQSDKAICYKFVRTIGIGESDLEEKIISLIDNQNDVTIAPYASLGEVYLRVTAKRDSYEEAELLVNKRIEEIKALIGDYIYATENISLQQVVISLLLEKNLKISSAESCTGGLFSSAVTSIPGSSNIFERGFITYSNEAKIDELDVPKYIIEKHGAVSHETARAMAECVKEVSASDIGISVTGIAGPGGGSDTKPVGLVYIGVSYKDKTESFKYLMTGNRDAVRHRSMLMMFKHIYDILWREYEK